MLAVVSLPSGLCVGHRSLQSVIRFMALPVVRDCCTLQSSNVHDLQPCI